LVGIVIVFIGVFDDFEDWIEVFVDEIWFVVFDDWR